MSHWLLVAILFFTLCSALASASQVALFSLPATVVQTYRSSRDSRKKRVAALLAQPRQLLVTLFMTDLLVNLLVQNFSSQYFGAFASWGLNVGVPLAITLIFGEILPKSYALSCNQRLAMRVAPFVALLSRVTAPLRIVLVRVASVVSHSVFSFLKRSSDLSKEEVLDLVANVQERDLIEEQEAEWIRGYLRLQNALVKELMHSREELLVYSLQDPLEQLATLFKQGDRVIVCRTGLDDPVGILMARDYFLWRDRLKDLSNLLKPLWFVPEHVKARSLLSDTREKDAVVIDEYGGIRGLLTHEDLLEAIFGKSDQLPVRTEQYTLLNPTTLISTATLELDALERLLQVSLPNPNNQVTVGGWLTAAIGDIPQAGLQVEKEGLFFHVLLAEPRRVQKLYIRKQG